ncbi:MAG: class I tRNA ligase family protein, partial [Candidatus Sungiibacteriota bacterium]
ARPASATRDNVEAFIKMLAPFAPHFAEELWSLGGNKSSIHKSSWPVFSKKHLQAESYELVIQVNGRVRASVKAAMGIGEEEARKLALESEAIKKYVLGVPKKVIFVKNRLINFVV